MRDEAQKLLPITQLNAKAWNAALDRPAIADSRWCDPRHTWAS